MQLTPEKHVLVLGCGGKVGRVLRHEFASRQDVLWQSSRPDAGADIVWQPNQPWSGPSDVGAIVALWGVTPPDGNLDLNSDLALSAIRLADDLGVARVLHMSSSAVYQDSPSFQTEDQARPVTPYGQAKHAMEQTVLRHSARGAACCLRLANVAGCDQLFGALRGGKEITLDRFPDGRSPMRSYLSASNLAIAIDGLLRCPKHKLPSIVNVANPDAYWMEDIVHASGRPFDWRPAPERAIRQVTLNTARLQEIVTINRVNAVGLWQEAADIWQSRK